MGDSYLIVLGKDISNPVIQGYRDGGCDEGEEITGVTADVERYETTLGEIVWKLLIEENEITIFEKEEGQWDIASDEMMFGSIAELMYDYGVLAEETAERYRWGALEDMWSETYTMGRVMYLAFDVTIPANSSVSVEASMIKDASFDHAGEGTDRNGYDLVTTLGSSLEFSGQTELLEYIREAKATRRQSMNDYPTVRTYYGIKIETDDMNYCYYIYEEGSTVYIEIPYELSTEQRRG